ncbi:MAG: helix-turn-helix domain-containing protein [Lachnospiraceae bacterium]|nr:helix-turn-helix domain-containing protein [Lachnospiraceae bacterium]
MDVNISRDTTVDQQVYLAADIQKILGIGKSKSYTFLEEIYEQKDPPFKVIKIGKLFRVPKRSFDEWLNGCA